LHGFKQAPRVWNHRIDTILLKIDFEICVSEQGVYVKCWIYERKEEKLLVCLYIDDMLVTGSNTNLINKFKSQMHNEFEMNDLGKLLYFLGTEFQNMEVGTIMHQIKYVRDLLSRFGMQHVRIQEFERLD